MEGQETNMGAKELEELFRFLKEFNIKLELLEKRFQQVEIKIAVIENNLDNLDSKISNLLDKKCPENTNKIQELLLFRNSVEKQSETHKSDKADITSTVALISALVATAMNLFKLYGGK